MKLVFVTPAYRPSFHEGSRGGGEISNQILLDGLAKKGVRVIVISMTPIIDIPVYRDGHIIIIEPGAKCIAPALKRILPMVFFSSILNRLFRKIKPNIVIGSTSAVKITAVVSKNMGIPVGAMVRAMENLPGYGWEWSKKSFKDAAKFFLHKFTIGWPGGRELDLVDFFVANSKFLEKKYLQSFPNKKSLVIYPTLAIEPTNTPLPKRIDKVLMVGTSEAKGFDIFCRLACKFPKVEFHAIGDRSLEPGTTRTIRGVTVHGWYANPIPCIDSVDLVLVPSIWEEAFGRISLEAMFRHKYVLVSNSGGLPETVSNENKLIVKSNSFSAWVERLSDIIESPEKYNHQILKAINEAKKFNPLYQCQLLENFIEKIANP